MFAILFKCESQHADEKYVFLKYFNYSIIYLGLSADEENVLLYICIFCNNVSYDASVTAV